MESQLRQQLEQIHNLLCVENADELLINGGRGCFLVSRFGITESPRVFTTTDEAADFARELAWQQGRRLDPYHPATGGSIDEWGLRWHAVINPVAQDEIILSVRRHRFEELDLTSFLTDPQKLNILQQSIHQRRPVLIAGATGVGKTTFLVSLLKQYFLNHRVVILESLSEIPSISPRWLRLAEVPAQISGKGAVSLLEVGRECLRLRPDVFVVGEIRGAEARVFIDMNQTGHGGCFATIHAGSVGQAMGRLKALAGDAMNSVEQDFEILVMLLERKNGEPVVSQMEIMRTQR